MAFSKLSKTLRYLRKKINSRPETALILGSGWSASGGLDNDFTIAQIIPYQNIPFWPVPTTKGHAPTPSGQTGKLFVVQLDYKPILILSGRAHYYEGFSPAEIVYPVEVLSHLGIKQLIVTNAAGGINPAFKPGDIMLIIDHINFILKRSPDFIVKEARAMSYSPLLRGAEGVSSLYDSDLITLARKAALKLNISLKEGVYLATSGPSYETAAEIRMMRFIGADAVGMSTVPEVLMARQLGLKVLGLSCVANQATGLTLNRLNHQSVLEVVEQTKETLSRLIKEII
ncbi:MAG: purine-nucleoside phosphorylase [Planctomycetota bacterium]